jgi:hypothetical protein
MSKRVRIESNLAKRVGRRIEILLLRIVHRKVATTGWDSPIADFMAYSENLGKKPSLSPNCFLIAD